LLRRPGNMLSKVALDPKCADLLGRDASLLSFLLTVAAHVEECVAARARCEVHGYVLGVYDAGGGIPELRPYVEARVGVRDVGTLVSVWRACLDCLAGLFGAQVLEEVGVYLTRSD